MRWLEQGQKIGQIQGDEEEWMEVERWENHGVLRFYASTKSIQTRSERSNNPKGL